MPDQRKPATGLAGLAAFGRMQAYTAVAEPVSEARPRPAEAEAAQSRVPDQPGYPGNGHHQEESYAEAEPSGPEGAYADPRASAEADPGYEPADADAAAANGGDVYTLEPGMEQDYDEQAYEDPAQFEAAYQDPSYREQPEAGCYPEAGYSPEELQQYVSAQEAMESEPHAHYQPGQQDYAVPESEIGSAPGRTALQTFEARYDQHPEIALGGFDELADEPGEQPFFPEQGQQDADFLDPSFASEPMEPARERKSRKMLMFGGGLLGALALGGALAFIYKTGSETKVADNGNPPLIQADKRPVKVAPSEPGGKKFPHKNKQIYDRLQGEQRPEVAKIVPRQEQPAAAPSAMPLDADKPAPGQPQRQIAAVDPAKIQPAQDPAGPRKVKTLQVRPDGTVVPPAQQPAPPTAQPAVPELPAPGADLGTGVAVTIPETPPAAPETTAAVPKQPPAVHEPQPQVQQPQPPAPAKPPVEAMKPPPAAPLPNPKPAAPAVVAKAPAKAPEKPPVKAATPEGSIYVVQVASRRSQAMALAAFADLQQKYTQLLGNYQPMIQSADLGNKGVWYRLRVGPISKKADAESLCRRLRSAGLRSCLVRPL